MALRTYICRYDPCGRSWEAESRPGQPPRYCSQECRRLATARSKTARHRARPRPRKTPTEPRLCENEKCRKPFVPRAGGKPQRFCSKRCGAGCYTTRTYTCQVCETSWEAESKPGRPPRYCSEECRKRGFVERATAWQKANPGRTKELKAATWARYYQANREELLEKSARYWRANPEIIAAQHAARYARTRGASHAEKFTLDEIFERDGGVCYLCHEDCPRNQATMDHIVPVSPPHNGPHTRANVKLAHRSCNTRKHTKLLSELPWYSPDPPTKE